MSVIRLQKLDAQGRPAGPVDVSVGSMAIGFDESGPYDDVEFTCDRTFTLSLTVMDVKPAAIALITGSRRVWGWPRKLAINGHEYNRRRRSR